MINVNFGTIGITKKTYHKIDIENLSGRQKILIGNVVSVIQ